MGVGKSTVAAKPIVVVKIALMRKHTNVFLNFFIISSCFPPIAIIKLNQAHQKVNKRKCEMIHIKTCICYNIKFTSHAIKTRILCFKIPSKKKVFRKQLVATNKLYYTQFNCKQRNFKENFMITVYDLDTFASKIKALRKSLGYTTAYVSKSTGVNQRTIVHLENGKQIPRIDTIQILSSFYKCDLLTLLSFGIKDSTTYKLFSEISEQSAKGNIATLRETLATISVHLMNPFFTPIECRDLEQLKIYVEGLLLVSDTCVSETHHYAALEKFSKAMRLSSPSFSIEHFENYKYTIVEMQIIYSMAVCYGFLRQCLLANRLLFFVHDLFFQLEYSSTIHKIFLSKLYYNLSYNFHRFDDHTNALHYADIGIKHCIHADTFFILALLLSRKGVALKHLNQTQWRKSLEQAMTLSELSGNTTLKTQLESILKEY